MSKDEKTESPIAPESKSLVKGFILGMLATVVMINIGLYIARADLSDMTEARIADNTEHKVTMHCIDVHHNTKQYAPEVVEYCKPIYNEWKTHALAQSPDEKRKEASTLAEGEYIVKKRLSEAQEK